MGFDYMAKEKSLEDLLDDVLIEKASKRGKARAIYPSSLGYCLRKVVYDMQNLPVNRNPTKQYKLGLRRMHDGHARHKKLTEMFKKAGILKDSEVSMATADGVRGRLDAIIELHKKLYVVEIKGINNRGFMTLNKAKFPHTIQLGYYMMHTKKDGILFYENKDTQDYKTFTFFYEDSQDLMDTVKERISLVNECLKNNTLPERTCSIKSYQRKWCDWDKQCWKEINNE